MTATGTEAPPVEPRHRIRSWAVPIGVALVLIVPAIAALVVLADPTWYPTGDMAQAELHLRGFWSHPPLVGAAGRIVSRDGVQGSHPGPSLWLAMYPVYVLGGQTSLSMMAAVASVNVVAMAVALWIAIRRGGWALAAILAGVTALLVRASGPEVFTEPWNPWLAIMPFLSFVLAAWSVTERDWPMAPIAVLAGSHAIQSHSGYLLVVGALLAAAAATGVVRSWGQDRRPMWRWGAVTLGVAALAWLPPVIDQLRRDPGNLTILWQNFRYPNEPYLAVSEVVDAVANQVSLFGPWLLGPDATGVSVIGTLLLLAGWAAAAWSAWRRRAGSELRLHGLLAVGVAAGVVSVSRIFGFYFEYTVRWFWVLVGLVVVASAWSLWGELAARRADQRSGRWALAGTVAATLGVVAVATVQFADRALVTGFEDSQVVGALVDDVEQGIDPEGRTLVRWWDPVVLGATGFGLVLELERRGVSAGVDQQFAAGALPHRVMPEETAAQVLYVVLGDAAIERAREIEGLTELAYDDLRTDAERTRSAELRELLEQRLVELGREDLVAAIDQQYGQARLLFGVPPLPDDVLAIVSEYVDLRQPAAVFVAEPGTVVPPLA